MTISFVGGGAGGISTTNVTFNFSSLLDASGLTPTLQQNDIVVVSIAYKTAAVWDKTPTGYTDAFANIYQDSTANDLNFKTSYKVMGASPDSSVTIPASSSRGAFTVHVLRGVDTTTPLDVTPTTTAGVNVAANPDPPSITPATAGAWVYCAGGVTLGSGAGSMTNSASLSSTTNHFQQSVGTSGSSVAAAGLKEDWASGAFNAAAFGGQQSGVSGGWAAVALALRPALTEIDGTGAVTDGPGTLAGTGTVGDTGAGAVTDGAGAIAGTGTVGDTGTGAAADGAEGVAGAAAEPLTGTGAASDGAEAVVGAAGVEADGAGAIADGADQVAGAADAPIGGAGAIDDGGELAAAAGDVALAGTGATDDGAEQVTGGAGMTAAGAADDGAEAVAGAGAVQDAGTGTADDGSEAVDGSDEAPPTVRMTRQRKVLLALKAAIETALPGVAVKGFDADDDMPQRVGAAGCVVGHPGDQSEPGEDSDAGEYRFRQRVEVDVAGPNGAGGAALEPMLAALSAAVTADRTLGGLTEWTEARSPLRGSRATEGIASENWATVAIVAEYVVTSPLGE